MRPVRFLNYLREKYNPARASFFASNERLKGGWEVWFQLEIAGVFLDDGERSRRCDREAPYPSGDPQKPWISYPPPQAVQDQRQASRCDFHLYRDQGIQDEVYVELKCINQRAGDPVQDAWTRYRSDVVKIRSIKQLNPLLNGIALLATFQTFGLPAEDLLGAGDIYVWDPLHNQVSSILDVQRGGIDRFFLVATS